MVALCGKNRFADFHCQGRGGSLATLESLSPEMKAHSSVGLNDLALWGTAYLATIISLSIPFFLKKK